MANKSCRGSVVGIQPLKRLHSCLKRNSPAVVQHRRSLRFLVLFHAGRRLSLFREGGRICSRWCKQSHLSLRLCRGSPQMACLRHSHVPTPTRRLSSGCARSLVVICAFICVYSEGGRFSKMTNMSRGNGKQRDLVWPFVC